MERMALRGSAWLATLALCACSGGGGDGGGSATPQPSASGWQAGSFLPAATFAGRCVNPRSGTDPQTHLPYSDIQGTTTDQNNWLRSWSNDLYLWYNEIVDRDPGLSATADYFNLLKTAALTPSGNPKDRFHFTYSTTEWLALVESGEQVGYGVAWATRTTNPPEVTVAYTEPSSPASDPSVDLRRGETVVAVDGINIGSLTNQTLWNAFWSGVYPETEGETHTFTLRDSQTLAQRNVTMNAAVVTLDPVQNVRTVSTSTGNVGYLQFNDHLFTAEQELIDAFTMLAASNVTDLVLDIRYNGGGLLPIASEVAYMIAGSVPTAGQTFEMLQFNDKHRSINPVTGAALTPMPFFNGSSTGQWLPTLNLPRVFVLTGPTTCSASESIINGLRGVNVQVVLVGSTTCGKPYGFYPKDNCGTTYFTVQFRGINAVGFGDYADGFSPNNATGVAGVRVPGCSVRDDFSRALGDPLEARFAAALEYRLSQSCPAPTGASPPGITKPADGERADSGGEAVVQKTPWLMNRSLGNL